RRWHRPALCDAPFDGGSHPPPAGNAMNAGKAVGVRLPYGLAVPVAMPLTGALPSPVDVAQRLFSAASRLISTRSGARAGSAILRDIMSPGTWCAGRGFAGHPKG